MTNPDKGLKFSNMPSSQNISSEQAKLLPGTDFDLELLIKMLKDQNSLAFIGEIANTTASSYNNLDYIQTIINALSFLEQNEAKDAWDIRLQILKALADEMENESMSPENIDICEIYLRMVQSGSMLVIQMFDIKTAKGGITKIKVKKPDLLPLSLREMGLNDAGNVWQKFIESGNKMYQDTVCVKEYEIFQRMQRTAYEQHIAMIGKPFAVDKLTEKERYFINNAKGAKEGTQIIPGLRTPKNTQSRIFKSLGALFKKK